MQLTDHFTLAELTRTGTGLANVPSETETAALRALAVAVLEPLRVSLGTAVNVTSGYRSSEVNAKVGGASSSQHTRGEAADIWVAGMSAEELARKIVGLGLAFDQIIVERDHPAEQWVHVSYCSAKRRGEVLRKVSSGYATWVPT